MKADQAHENIRTLKTLTDEAGKSDRIQYVLSCSAFFLSLSLPTM